MRFIILCLVLPLLTECKPLDNETTTADTNTSPDFEEIILTNDEMMGNISDLNPFDKQVIVEKAVLYFRRHLRVLGKAIRKLNDQNFGEVFKTVESQLDLIENIYIKDPDLKRFHDAMAAFIFNVFELQNGVIDSLSAGGVPTEEGVVEALKPDLNRGRYDWDHHGSDHRVELKLHELHDYLRRFTRFVEDVIEDVGDK